MMHTAINGMQLMVWTEQAKLGRSNDTLGAGNPGRNCILVFIFTLPVLFESCVREDESDLTFCSAGAVAPRLISSSDASMACWMVKKPELDRRVELESDVLPDEKCSGAVREYSTGSSVPFMKSVYSTLLPSRFENPITAKRSVGSLFISVLKSSSDSKYWTSGALMRGLIGGGPSTKSFLWMWLPKSCVLSVFGNTPKMQGLMISLMFLPSLSSSLRMQAFVYPLEL